MLNTYGLGKLLMVELRDDGKLEFTPKTVRFVTYWSLAILVTIIAGTWRTGLYVQTKVDAIDANTRNVGALIAQQSSLASSVDKLTTTEQALVIQEGVIEARLGQHDEALRAEADDLRDLHKYLESVWSGEQSRVQMQALMHHGR